MSIYYTHLLVPQPTGFCPSPTLVARFLQDIIDGLFSAEPTIHFRSLKRVTPKVRTGRNPVTGEAIDIRMPSRATDRQLTLSSVSELPSAVGEADEYNVDLSAVTKPTVAPLPVDFDDPYHLRVGCRTRARTVSLSTGHGAPALFEDCPDTETLGRFVDPHTGNEIQVAGAGCARFWIEFELGKFLVPEIKNGDLRVLHAEIDSLAARCVGTEYVQACLYG